jgi:hypothetical protein
MPEKKERRFSLFYSSLGAGYAPRDVRRKIKFFLKLAKISVSFKKFETVKKL